MKFIDMHCDTIMALMGNHKSLRENDLMIDLKRLKSSDYLLQCFAMFVPYKSRNNESYSPFELCHKMIDRYYQELDSNKDLIKPVFKYDDILDNYKNGYLSSLLTIEEGGVCLGNIEYLRNFYRLGVRMITLTWNFKNELASPNFDYSSLNGNKPDFETPNTKDGLTQKGIEFVKEMNRLGIVIDCSHLSDKGFYDVCKYSTKPIVCSHSNSRSVCNHIRNLTDDMLLKLKENGGVIGINFCKDFVTEEPYSYIEDLVKHIKYIKNLIGIDHVGLGSDFDGIGNDDIELKESSLMPKLIESLKSNGFNEQEIEKIAHLNVLRVFKENF